MNFQPGCRPLQRRLPPTPTPLAAPPCGPSRQQLPPALQSIYRSLDVPESCWGYPSGGIIAFAHGTLKVPAGTKMAEPLRLLPYQIEFIRDVYDVRAQDGQRLRRQAVLSVARRNGKSLLSAVLALAHFAGPQRRANSTIFLAATSTEQAGFLYRYVHDMAIASPVLMQKTKLVNSRKRMVHANGSILATVSSEVAGKLGAGLDVFILDECAHHRDDRLFQALRTSQSAQPEPLAILLGTQAADDLHWYSQIIDDGAKIRDGIYADTSLTVHLHAADDGCDLMDEDQWRKANPALGVYRSEQELRQSMAQAIRVPSQQNATKNFYLNMRVASIAPFITPGVWALGAAQPDEALLYDGRPVWGGLDLSTSKDLTSLVLAANADDGRTHLFHTSWTPLDTLDERGYKDRAPYRAFMNAGHLVGVPGASIDYDFVARALGDILMRRVNVQYINLDPYKGKFLRESLARHGVPVALQEFRQGFLTYSAATDAFEAAALDGNILHGNDPVLSMALANTRIEMDAAENRKPTKLKSTGRIDPAVAAIMAVAGARLREEAPFNVAAMIG